MKLGLYRFIDVYLWGFGRIHRRARVLVADQLHDLHGRSEGECITYFYNEMWFHDILRNYGHVYKFKKKSYIKFFKYLKRLPDLKRP